jgi:hypothetical protein
MSIRKDDDGLWKLWETRSVGFPRSGGRVLGVHGSGSFHRSVRLTERRSHVADFISTR